MAKAKGNVLISGYKGRIGSIDRTVGRDGGQMLNFIDGGKFTILGKKPLMPLAKSPGRQARSTAYCACDESYRTVSPAGRSRVQAYQIRFGTREEKSLTPFQFFMKLCLKGELCALKMWSGEPPAVTPPCPDIPLSNITHIAKYNPDTNYYGGAHAEIYMITNISSLEALIDLESVVFAPTLHTYHSYTGSEGYLLDVYAVKEFDPASVTWNTQPETIRKITTFTPTGNAWNAVFLDGPGRYIRIRYADASGGGYTAIRSSFYLAGEYKPYISY